MQGSTAIACFACSRPLHLHRTLSALGENPLSKKLPLIVFIDKAKNDENSEVTWKLQMIARANALNFLSVDIHVSSSNKGLFRSLVDGITRAFDDYDQVIVIEDDILVGFDFLPLMLRALSLYKDCEMVASIHGYTPPIKDPLPNTFFLPGADCWGWATWRDRWNNFRSDAGNMVEEIK